MKIEKISIYSYDLPLKEKIRVAGRELKYRKGLILIIRDSSGETGFGEISPLPGLDRETPESCMGDLAWFKDRYTGAGLSMDSFDLTLPLFGLCRLDKTPASTSLFGIESALLILTVKHKPGAIRGREAGDESDLSVPVNGLYTPGSGNADEQIRYLREKNFRTVKIKIGRVDRKMEIREIRKLAGEMECASLRLDGNRLLDPAALREYFDALKDLKVEYLEEPFPEGTRGDIPWPYAADESLREYLDEKNPDFTKIPRSCSAMVIKPSSLRGLHNIIRAVLWGDKNRFTVTLSSAYNTGPGLAALALAANCSKEHKKNCHGLDTYKYLERDIFKKPLVLDDGLLKIPGTLIFGNDGIDFTLLREVPL